MKNLKTLLFAFSFIALVSCSKDDSSNAVPNDFIVTIDDNELFRNDPQIHVNWTAAVDPDGDLVTYDVFLNNIEIDSDLSVLTTSFSSSELNANNVIKVIATDEHNASKESTVSYTAI